VVHTEPRRGFGIVAQAVGLVIPHIFPEASVCPVAPGRPDLRARKNGVLNANGEPFRLYILISYAFLALRWPRDGAALLTAPHQTAFQRCEV